MKITMISDMHGTLPLDLPRGDLLLIAGDICPAYNHTVSFQRQWLGDRFNAWLDFIPYNKEKIVLIAGNHDWVFEKEPHNVPELNCHYLEDSGVEIDGLNIWGFPHTPRFCNWAFNRNKTQMEEAANKIPDNTDILLTHGPPYGILDVVTEGFDMHQTRPADEDKDYLGCKKLKKRVNDMPDLKLHVFGHIHSSNGIQMPSKLGRNNTIFVNAAHLDESYQPTHDILTIDL